MKFHCFREEQSIAIPATLLRELLYWRDQMFRSRLIGCYPDGVGFGNLSARETTAPHFYISGTATGGLSELQRHHFTLVERCDFDQNCVWCKGPIDASSETMSHAIIYQQRPEVNAVIHIHSQELWEQCFEKLPTTSPQVEYGTPAMAHEIDRTLRETGLPQRGVVVMGGHPEGIIAFGTSLKEAANEIFSLYLKHK